MNDTPSPLVHTPASPPARARFWRTGSAAGRAAAREARLLALVERAAIGPDEALRIVAACRRKVRAAPAPGPDDALGSETERVAEGVVRRFATRAALVGGGTALGGVFPGAGTLVAAFGGSAVDALVCMKLQVDLCLCLAGVYGYDMAREETRHLACLLAAGGSLEGAGLGFAAPLADAPAGSAPPVRLASPEGVQVIRQYLKSAALQAAKEMVKRLGTGFGRRAVAKATPLGIGVLVGGGANYALTHYVGRQARQWFVLDQASRPREALAAPAGDGASGP